MRLSFQPNLLTPGKYLQMFLMQCGIFILLIMQVMIFQGCESTEMPDDPQRLTAESFFQKGIDARQKMDYQRALSMLDSSLQYHPEHLLALLHKGLIYAGLKDYAKSDSIYKLALAITPDFLDAKYNLANNAFWQERYQDAIAIYRELIDIQPTAKFWHNLGRAYLEVSDTSAARAAYKAAVSLDGAYAYGHASLGLMAERDGNFPEMRQHYRQAVKYLPGSDEYWYKLGLALMRVDSLTASEQALKKALGLNPAQRGAMFNLGKVYQMTGSPQAATLLEKAEELRSSEAEISRLQRNITQQPGAARPHYTLGMRYVKNAMWEEAHREFKAAIFLDPSHFHSYINLANIYVMRKQAAPAIENYLHALKIKPDAEEALANLGIVYFQNGEIVQARKYWQQLLNLNPDHPIALQGIQRIQAAQ